MTVRLHMYAHFREFEVTTFYTYQSISGYDVFGDPVKTDNALTPFKMNVQPMTPEELNQMPKGAELEQTLKFYTTEIIPIDDASRQVTNILIKNYEGKDYRVVSRKPYRNSDHIKYLCMEDRFDTA